MTFEHFHSLGKTPELMEQLKIAHIDSAIRSLQLQSNLVDMLSKPVALDLHSLDKRVPTTEALIIFNWKLALG